MDAKWNEIDALDLSSVKTKLGEQKGWWWRRGDKLNKLEVEYKQFLYLIATNPGKTVVPWTQDLDDMWHVHILDTRKYEEDCKTVFGKTIHHNPHLPVGSTKQKQAFNETKEMYKAAFDKKKGSAYEGSTGSSGGGDVIFMPVVFCGGGGDVSSHSTASSCGTNGDSGAAACGTSSSDGGGSSCGAVDAGVAAVTDEQRKRFLEIKESAIRVKTKSG